MTGLRLPYRRQAVDGCASRCGRLERRRLDVLSWACPRSSSCPRSWCSELSLSQVVRLSQVVCPRSSACPRSWCSELSLSQVVRLSKVVCPRSSSCPRSWCSELSLSQVVILSQVVVFWAEPVPGRQTVPGRADDAVDAAATYAVPNSATSPANDTKILDGCIVWNSHNTVFGSKCAQ